MKLAQAIEILKTTKELVDVEDLAFAAKIEAVKNIIDWALRGPSGGERGMGPEVKAREAKLVEAWVGPDNLAVKRQAARAAKPIQAKGQLDLEEVRNDRQRMHPAGDDRCVRAWLRLLSSLAVLADNESRPMMFPSPAAPPGAAPLLSAQLIQRTALEPETANPREQRELAAVVLTLIEKASEAADELVDDMKMSAPALWDNPRIREDVKKVRRAG